MDMFSKKPSSQDNVTRETNDTELPQPVQSETTAQPVVRKEKHSKAFSFVSVLFLLAILAVGVMAYLWYDQKTAVQSMQAEIDAAETTVSNLRTQLSKADGANPDDSVSSTPAKTDDDLIKEAVITYNHAFKATEKAQFTVTVTKKEAEFAQASFTSIPPEGGAKCVLKKVDGTWLVLFCGQGVPKQTELDAWAVPKSFMAGA